MTLTSDNWKKSQCNCPAFLKRNRCKHIIAIAATKHLVTIPIAAKQVLIDGKKPKGRPQLAKKALVYQP